MASEKHDVTTVEAALKQTRMMLAMYTDKGWGAHWELVGNRATKMLFVIDQIPEFDDPSVVSALETLRDAANALEAARQNTLQAIDQHIASPDKANLWLFDSE